MMLRGVLGKIVKRLGGKRTPTLAMRFSESVVRTALDRLVEQSDPHIKAVRGYRARLRPAVDNVIGYIKDSIGRIPGPLNIQPTRWDTDPSLNAFFLSGDQVRSVCEKSPELKDFFAQGPFSECYALLTMERKERTVFVNAVEGQIVKRDVPRQTLTFSGHRVVAASKTLARAKDRLAARALDLLARQALDKIIDIESRQEELETLQSLLKAQLKMMQANARRIEPLAAGGSSERRDAAEAQQLLGRIQDELKSSRSELSTRDDHLVQLLRVLEEPANYLRLEPVTSRLNRMGVKLSKDSEEKGNDIVWVDIHVGGHYRRSGVFARISRDIADFG